MCLGSVSWLFFFEFWCYYVRSVSWRKRGLGCTEWVSPPHWGCSGKVLVLCPSEKFFSEFSSKNAGFCAFLLWKTTCCQKPRLGAEDGKWMGDWKFSSGCNSQNPPSAHTLTVLSISSNSSTWVSMILTVLKVVLNADWLTFVSCFDLCWQKSSNVTRKTISHGPSLLITSSSLCSNSLLH